MFVVGVGPQFGDGTGGDEDGDEDGLPEREEEDDFDAKELGHQAEETMKILSQLSSEDDMAITYRNGRKSSLTHIQNMARQ